MQSIEAQYTTQNKTIEEELKLGLIHSLNTEQNRLKKTLLKFNLLDETVLDPTFSFNIICKPQEDGAGDFSLINKIGKELIANGVPANKITFMISTQGLYKFLLDFDDFKEKNTCEVNKLIFSQIKINDIPNNLRLIGLDKESFNLQPNSNTRNRILNKSISDIRGIDKNSLNKNLNYNLINEVTSEFGLNFKKHFQSIKSDIYGGKLGTLITFIQSRIIDEPEFTGSSIVFLDWSSGESTDINPVIQDFLDNCKLNGQDEKTINLQLLGTVTKYINTSILSRCNRNRVFYLNEGGVDIPSFTHYMGIGNGSLGIFKAPNVIKTKENVVNELTKKLSPGDEPILKYHIAYVGQMLDYEINKIPSDILPEDTDNILGIFNIQRVFLFLKLLKKKYETVQNETIYVFALSVFKKILDIYSDRINASRIFPEFNSVNNTFSINTTSKIKIKFFDRIPQELFYAFVKYSEPILFTTGDQSYQEALSFGKLVFHDYFDHRMRMVEVLLNCYNTFCSLGTNNYKQFLQTYLNSNSKIEKIFEYTFDSQIVRFFSNNNMILSLEGTLNDFFNSNNVSNQKFYDFYKKFYDFKVEFKKIIWLMQNDKLQDALAGGFMSQVDEQRLTNVNKAGYREKYLKYKNKYLTLKKKIGGAITWNDENMIGDSFKNLSGLNEERSKHSPKFTDKQIELSVALLTYLNESSNIRFKLNADGVLLKGNSIIQDYETGKILGRGANGIAICYDDNIVIKISKNSQTRRNIVEDEVSNMIELYRTQDGYNFRDENLVKLLGVVYVDDQNHIRKIFDNTRTHISKEFEPNVREITELDRIGFVIMEKYEGTLSNIPIVKLNTKLDIINQMLSQLNYFFRKGYYHTDLHDENWFYKMDRDRYIIRISDYGSEIKGPNEKIGVFRLSADATEQNKQKAKSLEMLSHALSQKKLINVESYFKIVGVPDFSQIKTTLREELNIKYRTEARVNPADNQLLDNINRQLE